MLSHHAHSVALPESLGMRTKSVPMASYTAAMDPNQNRILAALPEDDYSRLASHLEPIALPSREVLHEAETPIRWVYFPTSGMVSLVLVMSDGALAEVGMVGREGMVGVSVFLGS